MSTRTSRDSHADVTGKSSRAGTRAGALTNDGDKRTTTRSDSNSSFVREDLETAIATDNFMDVVQPLDLTDPQLIEAFTTWQRNPEAVEEIATKALSSEKARSKPAVFLKNLRDIRDDVVSTFISEHGGRWPTGSRWSRAGAGGSFVKDPLGYDKPDYAVDWGKPTHGEIKRALAEHPEAIKGELSLAELLETWIRNGQGELTIASVEDEVSLREKKRGEKIDKVEHQRLIALASDLYDKANPKTSSTKKAAR